MEDAIVDHFNNLKHDVIASIDSIGDIIFRLSREGNGYVTERHTNHGWEETDKNIDIIDAVACFTDRSLKSGHKVLALDSNDSIMGKRVLYKTKSTEMYHIDIRCDHRHTKIKHATNTRECHFMALHLVFDLMNNGRVCKSCLKADDCDLDYLCNLWSQTRTLFATDPLVAATEKN